MRERPILFSGAMVRALLDGTKTQTRRVKGLEQFNAAPDEWTVIRPLDTVEPRVDGRLIDFPGATPGSWLALKNPAGIADFGYQPFSCPYGVPGDRLWVRESVYGVESGDPQDLCYRVACPCGRPEGEHAAVKCWRPSVHMPRWASRITLEITDVRVQRVRDISDDDAIAEGARRFPNIPDPHPYRQGGRWSMGTPASTDQCRGTPRHAFGNLWDSLNAERGYGWESNPWVWALTFRRIEEGARDAE